MLEEEATVISVSHGQALVALTRSDACSGCAASNVCHPSSGDSMQMQVADPVGVAPGQRVVVALPAGELLRAGATAYLLPATAIVCGAAVGWSRSGTDMGAMIGAALGLALATVAMAVVSRRRSRSAGPMISRIIR